SGAVNHNDSGNRSRSVFRNVQRARHVAGMAGIQRGKINLRPRRGCSGTQDTNSQKSSASPPDASQIFHRNPPIIGNPLSSGRLMSSVSLLLEYSGYRTCLARPREAPSCDEAFGGASRFEMTGV